MLVIANGAFKSGSTWQRNLIKGLTEFEALPENFQSKLYETFIDANRLAEIINSPKIKEENYLAKSHIFKKEKIELLTSNKKDVKIFMIQRDTRDAIVSHYNHFINARKVKLSFRMYYWLIGRFKAIQLFKYNRNWASYNENVFHSSFESLKTDTSGELKKFANFLGITVSDEKIQRIIDANSIEKQREKSHRRWFFRKGKIGDYKNFLTPSMEKDLKRIQNKTNAIDEAIYFILFELRHNVS